MECNCIICLDDIEPIKCIELKCCIPLTGIGKKVCYQCISLLYIENKKKMSLNPMYTLKCPHCNQILSLEITNNMKYIYMQLFTDDERQQLETLYDSIKSSNENAELESRRIQQEQRALKEQQYINALRKIRAQELQNPPIIQQELKEKLQEDFYKNIQIKFDIEEYKNYIRLCKEHSIKERIEKQRQEAKLRHLQELCKIDKYDDTFIDNLIIKDKMSKQEIFKICEQAKNIKKHNPKIFNKKSNKMLCDYYDDFYNDFYNDD